MLFEHRMQIIVLFQHKFKLQFLKFKVIQIQNVNLKISESYLVSTRNLLTLASTFNFFLGIFREPTWKGMEDKDHFSANIEMTRWGDKIREETVSEDNDGNRGRGSSPGTS